MLQQMCAKPGFQAAETASHQSTKCVTQVEARQASDQVSECWHASWSGGVRCLCVSLHAYETAVCCCSW